MILIKPKVLAARGWMVDSIVQSLIHTNAFRLAVVNKACTNMLVELHKGMDGRWYTSARIILTFELPVYQLHLAKHITLALGGQCWSRFQPLQLILSILQVLLHFHIFGFHKLHHLGIICHLSL